MKPTHGSGTFYATRPGNGSSLFCSSQGRTGHLEDNWFITENTGQ